MSSQLQITMQNMIAAIHAKDLDSLMSYFSEDAVLYDPHYPNPRMVGKAAIADGLNWAFNGMREFGFFIEQVFESGDGSRGAVELNTSHVLKTGQKLNFPQVFVVETTAGKISRLQAYEPYGPNGIHGLVLSAVRFVMKLFGKR